MHDDHFPQNAADEDWLPLVGARGWIVLSKDKRLRKVPLQREALVSAGVRAFVMTAGNLTGSEMANAFLLNMQQIVLKATTHPAPFVAGVSTSGVRVYKFP